VTSHELLDALKETGTGEHKILAARVALEQRPGLSPEELLAIMEEPNDVDRPLWPEGTLHKARKILAGAHPDSFKGAPPPMGKDASEERLAKMMAGEIAKVLERLGDKQADKQAEAEAMNIGRPVKPSVREGPVPTIETTPRAEHPERDRTPGIKPAERRDESERTPGVKPAAKGGKSDKE
jgi:hypothetical protein